jgi:hypothetical protein
MAKPKKNGGELPNPPMFVVSVWDVKSDAPFRIHSEEQSIVVPHAKLRAFIEESQTQLQYPFVLKIDRI